MKTFELPEIKPHKYAGMLRQYPTARLAKALNISTNYLYGVIGGVYRPSSILDMKIKKLMEKMGHV